MGGIFCNRPECSYYFVIDQSVLSQQLKCLFKFSDNRIKRKINTLHFTPFPPVFFNLLLAPARHSHADVVAGAV